MKPKPKIRISRLRRFFICTGFGVSGTGETMRESWESWTSVMIACGKGRIIPGLQH